MEIIEYLFNGRAVERYVVLLILFVVLVLGIILLVSGWKIRKNGGFASAISGVLGIVLISASLYFAFWAIFLGYNS